MQQDNPSQGQFAESLNRDCHCIAVDTAALRLSLQAHLSDAGVPGQLLDAHSHLFATSPVFLSPEHVQKMAQVVRAVERVANNGAYTEQVLSCAPDVARQSFGPRGVFFGYDFHLGADGPQLIEINTNAGGVLLNVYLAAAQRACCTGIKTLFDGKVTFAEVENQLIAMFREEWHLQRADQTMYTIAIVDNEPKTQFLYPEFLLFQSLFKRHGIEAVIADPRTFTIRDSGLWVGATKVDLVYNRLTDFYLQTPESASLKEAYQQGFAVFTPSPHVYALYADKRNLPLFSNAKLLRQLAVDEQTIDVLSHAVPATVKVSSDIADQLWKKRKQLFFKPVKGYGSRGAYRGAKLTRRVWENIIQGDYIAQTAVPPSERILLINGQKQSLKLDIRCVTYDGRVQQLSARLYQGQTTNLRTEGGGLATVFATP